MPRTDPGDRRKDAALQLLKAENAFIRDADRRDVEYWYEQFLRGVVPIEEARRQATINRWYEQRDAFWKGVSAVFLRQRQFRLINERTEELHEFQAIEAAVLEMLRPVRDPSTGEVRLRWQPKSLEGLVKCAVSLDSLIEGKRELIVSQMDPMLQDAEQQAAAASGATEQQRKLPLTRSEMRAFAHKLLAKRAAQRRKDLGIEDDDEIEESGQEDEDGDEDGDEDDGTHAPKEVEARAEVARPGPGDDRGGMEGEG